MMIKTTILLLFFPLIGISQTATMDGKLWLANNRSEAVGQADSVVTRNFFDAEWVDVRSDFTIDTMMDLWFVIQPNSGPATAFRTGTRELSTDALSRITSMTEGATLMVLFQSRDPKGAAPKMNKLVLRLL